MAKYASKEWCQALVDKMNSDVDYQKKAEGLTLKMLNIITDCPDGTDKAITWEIKDGKGIGFTHEEKKAPSDFRTMPFDARKYDFRTTATWDANTKINKGELNAMQAISAKLYKIDGPMMKLLGLMAQFTAWAELMTTIPVEY